MNSEYIWSFLLFTGYLKVTAYETIGDETYYEMVIPNTEVKSIYKKTPFVPGLRRRSMQTAERISSNPLFTANQKNWKSSCGTGCLLRSVIMMSRKAIITAL